MDPAVAALVEQVKAQIADNLHGVTMFDLKTLESWWTREMVKDAIDNSMPKTGVVSFAVGDPYQPTYQQWVGYYKEQLVRARDRFEYAAGYDSKDWEDARDAYEDHVALFISALKGMRKYGPEALVKDACVAEVKVQPAQPAPFIELTFDIGPTGVKS